VGGIYRPFDETRVLIIYTNEAQKAAQERE